MLTNWLLWKYDFNTNFDQYCKWDILS